MARVTLKIAALAASLFSSASAAATSGDFNILTMNVAGIPAILQSNDVPGDKTTNARTIGTLFAKYGYDVIHVQEGWSNSTIIRILQVLTVQMTNNNQTSTIMRLSTPLITTRSELQLQAELYSVVV